VIIGYIPADYRKDIEGLAAAVGVSDRLTITNHVSPEDYEKRGWQAPMWLCN
jgi:hypothetical protein